MKSDAEIKHTVLQELAWDTRVKETEVGVEAGRGVVTLTGTVDYRWQSDPLRPGAILAREARRPWGNSACARRRSG